MNEGVFRFLGSAIADFSKQNLRARRRGRLMLATACFRFVCHWLGQCILSIDMERHWQSQWHTRNSWLWQCYVAATPHRFLSSLSRSNWARRLHATPKCVKR